MRSPVDVSPHFVARIERPAMCLSLGPRQPGCRCSGKLRISSRLVERPVRGSRTVRSRVCDRIRKGMPGSAPCVLCKVRAASTTSFISDAARMSRSSLASWRARSSAIRERRGSRVGLVKAEGHVWSGFWSGLVTRQRLTTSNGYAAGSRSDVNSVCVVGCRQVA